MYGEITNASRLGLENLRQWYEEYLETKSLYYPKPAIIQVLDDDNINNDQIEQEISLCASRLPDFAYFCGDCREAFDHWSSRDGGPIRRTNTIALEAATRKGCRFCSYVFHCIVDDDDMVLLRRIEGRLQALGECVRFEIQSYTYLTNTYAVIKPPGRAQTSGLSRLNLRIIYLDPNADTYEHPTDTHSICAKWLRECDQGHDTCIATASESLPTRLVRITSGGIRLVLTAAWTTKPRYATLSHCWGTSNFLQLRKQNVDTFLYSIPLESLPQTFRDAIDIARKLSLEFIWIDSLCIIQDDDRDWQAEAAQMGSVYGGSFVNIAASSAKDAHAGCFLKPENRVEGFRARIQREDRTHAVVQFERRNCYSQNVAQSHLATRAWAFQEKMLSPRTIHFGDRGIFWECSSKLASEFVPDGLLVHGSGMIGSLKRFGPSQGWWSNAVRMYTAANLTLPRDKLPALSGVAKRINELSGADYLAGIWKDSSIEHQLCWSVRLEHCRRKSRDLAVSLRPRYRAPSWSWASVNDPVTTKFQTPSYKLYAQVVDGWTTPAYGQDRFGEVTDGAIRVSCLALLEGIFTDCLTGDGGGHSIGLTLVSGRDLEVRSWKDSLEDFEGTDKYRCFLLPFIKQNRKRTYSISGILVHPTNRTKGEFQRVGMFETVDHKTTDLHPLSHALELQGEATARAECAEIVDNTEHPSRRFVITIV